jgi:hypothetical protein
MIANLQPYPEYKESGLAWITKVPSRWSVNRLRHACEMFVSNVDKHTKAGGHMRLAQIQHHLIS